jgi:hypothetical protein
MTFIASVVARKGVALIADSLVTTSRPILEFDDFYKYLQALTVDDKGELKLDTGAIMKLFKSKPSYTKDYQEKLFEYDRFTAISIAGAANLNNKSIEEIIANAIKKFKPNGRTNKKTIEEKVEELRLHFKEEVVLCVNKGEIVRDTVLIITNYSKTIHKTKIFKLHVTTTKKSDLEKDGYEPVFVNAQHETFKVICEGQNRISERILWGELDFMLEIIPRVANKIFNDFAIKPEDIPNDYVTNMFSDKTILPSEFYDDIKMNKISELSLQQAINLACLLMKIERDIQKYTENIPTVGGVVKIAIIDKDGFKFISGNDIAAIEEFK